MSNSMSRETPMSVQRAVRNEAAEGRRVQAQCERSSSLSGVFKGNRIAGESVRHDAGGEGERVADNAHQHHREQAENNAAGVAPQIRYQAAQAFDGGRFPGGLGSPITGGWRDGAHRSVDLASCMDGDSSRKCSYVRYRDW